jgi:hypothetical protein
VFLLGPEAPGLLGRLFADGARGYGPGMELPILLIVIGIVLAILVNYALGIIVILAGLVLLIWPRIRAGSAR